VVGSWAVAQLLTTSTLLGASAWSVPGLWPSSWPP